MLADSALALESYTTATMNCAKSDFIDSLKSLINRLYTVAYLRA